MIQFLAVGLGGFCGATLRWYLSSVVHERFEGAFPLGTLLVNLVGCAALGALWGLVDGGRAVSEELRLFLSVGLLGGLTTFSTFGLETVSLWRDGEEGLAFLSVAANLALGLGGVLAGRWLVRALA